MNQRRAAFDVHQPALYPLRVYLIAQGDDLIACCGWLGGGLLVRAVLAAIRRLRAQPLCA